MDELRHRRERRVSAVEETERPHLGQAKRHADQAKREGRRTPRAASGAAGWVADRAAEWTLDGPDWDFLERQKYLWNPLMDYWFRMEVSGWDNLPEPPALLIGIHSGAPFLWDAWTIGGSGGGGSAGAAAHGTAHDALMALPILGCYFRRMGVLPAAPDSIAARACRGSRRGAVARRRARLAASVDASATTRFSPGGRASSSWRSARRPDRAGLDGRRPRLDARARHAAAGSRSCCALDRVARLKMFPIALQVPWGVSPALLPEIPLPTKIRTAFQEPIRLDHDPERAEDAEYVLATPTGRSAPPSSARDGRARPAPQAAAARVAGAAGHAALRGDPPLVLALGELLDESSRRTPAGRRACGSSPGRCRRTTSWSTHSAPAFRRSVSRLGHEVTLRPLTTSGLDQHPRPVADHSRRACPARRTRARTSTASVIDAQLVGVRDAARQHQPVVARTRSASATAELGGDLVALVEVIPRLDLALLQRDQVGPLRPAFRTASSGSVELRLLDALGEQERHTLVLQLVRHAFQLLCSRSIHGRSYPSPTAIIAAWPTRAHHHGCGSRCSTRATGPRCAAAPSASRRELADGLLDRGQQPLLITSHPDRRSRRVENGLPVVRVPRPPQGALERMHFESIPHARAAQLLGTAPRLLRPRARDVSDRRAGGAPVAPKDRPAGGAHVHGDPGRAWLDGARGRREITRRAVRSSDAVVVLSEAAAQALLESLGRDPQAIHPGVDLGAFRPAAGRRHAPTIVCTAAPDVARKNVGLLVRAFTALRERIGDVRLVLVRPRSRRAAERGRRRS